MLKYYTFDTAGKIFAVLSMLESYGLEFVKDNLNKFSFIYHCLDPPLLLR